MILMWQISFSVTRVPPTLEQIFDGEQTVTKASMQSSTQGCLWKAGKVGWSTQRSHVVELIDTTADDNWNSHGDRRTRSSKSGRGH